MLHAFITVVLCALSWLSGALLVEDKITTECREASGFTANQKHYVCTPASYTNKRIP